MQTLQELGAGQGSTIVLPHPIDVTKPLALGAETGGEEGRFVRTGGREGRAEEQ